MSVPPLFQKYMGRAPCRREPIVHDLLSVLHHRPRVSVIVHLLIICRKGLLLGTTSSPSPLGSRGPFTSVPSSGWTSPCPGPSTLRVEVGTNTSTRAKTCGGFTEPTSLSPKDKLVDSPGIPSTIYLLKSFPDPLHPSRPLAS